MRAGQPKRPHSARVLSELADHAAETSHAVIIVVIDGTAGIGKTALAIHAAHQIADRFPGGQLYINLREFDLTASPVEQSEAIPRCGALVSRASGGTGDHRLMCG